MSGFFVVPNAFWINCNSSFEMCLSFSGPSRTINIQNINQTQPIVPAQKQMIRLNRTSLDIKMKHYSIASHLAYIPKT